MSAAVGAARVRRLPLRAVPASIETGRAAASRRRRLSVVEGAGKGS